MKQSILYVLVLCFASVFAQDTDKAKLKAIKKANALVYEANTLANNDEFVSAEMEYRKALSEQPALVAGAYNLGHAYFKEGNFEEALYRHQQAIKNATSKAEKHKAFHNIGNILMKNEKCREAVEAYKNALRNDPTDDESRYNLALAQDCAKNEQPPEEEDDKDDKDKDKKEDENKDENKDEGENKENDDNSGDQDKKDGENENEEDGKSNDDQEDEGDQGDDKKEQQKPQQQPGQMSPQQIKNLLEAMNNQEQKVQEKMNAEKAKGVKVQTDKDW